MLLGLMAAALLAMLLQLNALRARRETAFECAADGVIHLRCWVVVETPDIQTDAHRLAARPMLALPAPVRRPEPLRFVGEMRMMRPRPKVRRPLATPPMVHAGVNRLRAREGPILVRPGARIRMLPAEPSWPAHSRAPPGMAPPRFAHAALLH